MLNFTFGTKGEKFYQDTNYLTWSLILGLGSTPEYSLSETLKIIIMVGFGLPVLAMTISILYFIVSHFWRRAAKHQVPTEEIHDEIPEETNPSTQIRRNS